MSSGKLAIHGGQAVVPKGMVKPWPHITDEDRQAVMEVLADGNILPQRTLQNESLTREWAEYLGVRYCIPTNSGTSALHMAVAGLGIEPGDEVIVPAFTYWASAAAVLHHNAIPIFVDIDPHTYTIDPTKIEARISDRTRAIMPVHIHGLSADMDPILEIARKHSLAVIEDCAQSHGARYKGKLCGTMGDAAGFSTQASKVLTTGSEGGLFTTNDELVHKRAALTQYLGELVVPGRERETQDYNAHGLGWVYRPDVFGQAFVRSQLKRLDANNDWRRKNCAYLTERLQGTPGLSTPYEPEGSHHIYYVYTLEFYPEQLKLDIPTRAFRDRLMEALAAEGVPNTQWQRMAVPSQEVFQAKDGYGKGCPWSCPYSRPGIEYRTEDYPMTNRFVDRNIYLLGIYPPNGEDLMELYVQAIEKVIGQVRELF
ncbi:MAG: DegT/DnrJ/EryC1/StrS family aminotransferase [Armatimonadetes bacterium]|nr:DegT/DnrJ/EryC1/StrS family aminotransferase [Armatimonadota bacterium]